MISEHVQDLLDAAAVDERLAQPASSAEIMKAAVEVVDAAGEWVTTKDMLPAVEAKGIRVGGADPLGYLSTVLSRNKVQYNLVSNRRLGWNLVRNGDAQRHDAPMEKAL